MTVLVVDSALVWVRVTMTVFVSVNAIDEVRVTVAAMVLVVRSVLVKYVVLVLVTVQVVGKRSTDVTVTVVLSSGQHPMHGHGAWPRTIASGACSSSSHAMKDLISVRPKFVVPTFIIAEEEAGLAGSAPW